MRIVLSLATHQISFSFLGVDNIETIVWLSAKWTSSTNEWRWQGYSTNVVPLDYRLWESNQPAVSGSTACMLNTPTAGVTSMDCGTRANIACERRLA